MKRIIYSLILLATMPSAFAQCQETFTVPYQIDADAVSAPELPNCVFSINNSFASTETFQTLQGPVPGFEGNVLAYNTIIDSEFIPPNSPVGVLLVSPYLQLEQGINYIISYKYGNSDSQLVINNLDVAVSSNTVGSVNVSSHQNITGAVVTTFESQPFTVPATGDYYMAFSVYSAGSQGLLCLDDIEIKEAPTMGINNHLATSINAYPNPVQDILQLNNSNNVEQALLYNMAGQHIKTYEMLYPYAVLDMNIFPSGLYFLSVASGASNEIIKIVKK